jgi:hypothetical protein
MLSLPVVVVALSLAAGCGQRVQESPHAKINGSSDVVSIEETASGTFRVICRNLQGPREYSKAELDRGAVCLVETDPREALFADDQCAGEELSAVDLFALFDKAKPRRIDLSQSTQIARRTRVTHPLNGTSPWVYSSNFLTSAGTVFAERVGANGLESKVYITDVASVGILSYAPNWDLFQPTCSRSFGSETAGFCKASSLYSRDAADPGTVTVSRWKVGKTCSTYIAKFTKNNPSLPLEVTETEIVMQSTLDLESARKRLLQSAWDDFSMKFECSDNITRDLHVKFYGSQLLFIGGTLGTGDSISYALCGNSERCTTDMNRSGGTLTYMQSHDRFYVNWTAKPPSANEIVCEAMKTRE